MANVGNDGNILPGTVHHSLVKDQTLAPPEMLFK